jgi:hypothetical protein
MREFLGRWAFCGLACAGALAVVGVRGSGALFWVLAVLWMGFWNAALRPVVLRFGLEGRLVFWLLFMALLILNVALFLGVSSWLPVARAPERAWLLAGALGSALCSWGASARFRAHDGSWHWLHYHGSMSKPPDRA